MTVQLDIFLQSMYLTILRNIFPVTDIYYVRNKFCNMSNLYFFF